MKAYKLVRMLENGQMVSLFNDVPDDDWFISRGFLPQLKYSVGSQTVDHYGVGMLCYRKLRHAERAAEELAPVIPKQDLYARPIAGIAVLQVEAKDTVSPPYLCGYSHRFPRQQELYQSQYVPRSWFLCKTVMPVKVVATVILKRRCKNA